VLEPEFKKGKPTTESDIKTHMMRRSIFAYWSVFTDRFVDNLHLRVQHNLLMCFDQLFYARIMSKYIPGSNQEFSEDVCRWMEEPSA
jgi:hypothetical protein